MTDTPEPNITMTDAFNALLARAVARDRLQDELLPANKKVIFDALASVGIVSVVVTFDGCGDSGQIESIDARDVAGDLPVPNVTVDIGSPPIATNSEEAMMGHCYHHALSSIRKWGGVADDYIALHSWCDESKSITADFQHRALRHHTEGIFMFERLFGVTITISTGRVVPVRLIGEQHVIEDLGFVPSFADWVRSIRPQPWMGRAQPIHRLVDPFAEAASG